jgi:Acetyltransferase (GNAT) domain
LRIDLSQCYRVQVYLLKCCSLAGANLSPHFGSLDLWVLRESRGHGVGERLLVQGEAEIIARGHETLHLRVVQSNAAAIEFYRRHGWRIARNRQTPTASAYILQDKRRIHWLSLRKNIVILVILFLDLVSLTRHFICIFLQPLGDGGLVRATLV